MEKRILLAVFLSSIVLLGYNVLISKTRYVEQPIPKAISREIPSAKTEPLLAQPEIKQEKALSSRISLQHNMLENADLKLRFTNVGARLDEIYLKQFNRKFFETQLFNLQEVTEQPFVLTSDKDNKLVYEYEDGQKKIIKTYSISNNNIELDINVQNITGAAQNYDLNLNLLSLNMQQDSLDFLKEKNYLELNISQPDKILRKPLTRIGSKNIVSDQIKFSWIGLKDRYFCSIFKPNDPLSSYYIQVLENKTVIVGVPIIYHNLQPKASFNFRISLYVGPLKSQAIGSVDNNFIGIINYGTFDPISKALLSTMRFIHKFLPNWGVCIIVLSCLLFLLLYPLTLKSLNSMKAMQAVQPQMEKLRQQYKDQPQKLNQEIMALYKKNKVNPFGGCLPMVLQIPIFIALYQALLRSLELRGAKFLWIKDLSESDKLFMLPFNLPVLGNEFNILPILMALIMLFQQKLTSKSTVSANPEQQKLMTIFFPILFGFMFYRLPSGLVLYWFVYSGLSLFFQWKQTAAIQKV